MEWNVQSDCGAIGGLGHLDLVNINLIQHLSPFVFPGPVWGSAAGCLHDQGKSGMKVYCGAAVNIPVLYLFSSLDFHECVMLESVPWVTFGPCVWLWSVSSLQRLGMSNKPPAPLFLVHVMSLEHLLCPLSVKIMCECGRVSHLSARTKPALLDPCFLDFHDFFFALRTLTGTRRTWIEKA